MATTSDPTSQNTQQTAAQKSAQAFGAYPGATTTANTITDYTTPGTTVNNTTGQTVQNTQTTAQPTTSTSTSNPYSSLTQFTTGMTDDQVRALANQYITAGGAPNTDNGQYWVNAYHQFGATDPGYFQTRLEQGITQNVTGQGATGSTGSTAYVPGQGVAGQGTVFGSNNPLTAQQTALEQQMINNLSTAENPVTANDPIIKAQTDAFNAQQQQAARNYQTQAAESGGPDANLSAVARSQAEQVGQNTSGMEATLMGNEVNARRSEIENLLSQQSGLLTSEQSMQLQEELAQLNLANNAINTNNTTLNQSGNPTTA